MTVGERVVARLASEGIDTVFGIPGKQTLPLNEAMAAHGIRFVVARHETAVSHQAWGYAETSGEMAATVVVPGPGDMNAMNGLKNALNDCTPLVHVAVETDPAVRGGDGIHETPPDTYDNVVKANRLVEEPGAAVATLAEAMRIARTPPKGPVRVGIPKNFLTMDVPQAAPPADSVPTPPEPDPDAVATAATTLQTADDPVVIAGGGVRTAEATAELRAVAERLDAPVVTTYKGKGTLPEAHSLSAGVSCGATSPELEALIADADAALAVGTDFDAVAFGRWERDLPDELVHVTLHAEDVVALTGDGGLLMCIHELHTLAAEAIDVTVVAFRNDDYAIISEEAERSYGLDEMAYGWRDAPLSLTDIAAGMGVEAERVETADAVERAVSAAVEADGPRLVSVPTDPTEPQASEWFAGEE